MLLLCITPGSTWWRNMKFLDKSHVSLHRHPEVSLEVVEEETLLILQENLFDFLPNWVIPYQGGCSQFLIFSRSFDSSAWVLKNNFPFWEILLLRVESFRVDFWCLRRFQLLNVCNLYVTLLNSPSFRAYPRNNPGSQRMILDLSFAETG